MAAGFARRDISSHGVRGLSPPGAPRRASPDRRLRGRRVLDGERQPADGRLRPLPDRQGAAAGLLPALGERRRRPLHRPLLPRVRGRPCGGLAHLAVPAPPQPARPARAPALPGPDLRGRRQPRQPARGLAGPRPRRDPRRGLGARRRPLRPLSRRALLVHRRPERLQRPAGTGRGPRSPALELHRALRRGARAPHGVRAPAGGGDAAGIRGRGRGGPALPRALAARRRRLASRRLRPRAAAGRVRAWSPSRSAASSSERAATAGPPEPEPALA